MRRAILQRIASTVALTALFGGMLFLGAGTFWFPRAWVFLGLSLALFTINLLWTLRANPAAIGWPPKPANRCAWVLMAW